MSELIYLNGINGDTGKYLFDPMTFDDAASLARRNPPERGFGHVEAFRGLPYEIEPTDVSKAGWAVVFEKETDPAVREALQPLIDHRQRHVEDDRCKVLEYVRGQGLRDWLKSHEVFPGSVSPNKVPYYLLLVGTPTEIPFEFQYLLDIEYAVGRLCFDEPEQYYNYAQSLIRFESGDGPAPAREVAYWSVRHDKATELSSEYLVKPLSDGSDEAKSIAEQRSFRTVMFREEQATRQNLINLLHGKHGSVPALLCTASHGLGWKREQVDLSRQQAENGALLCQDWPGEGPVEMDHFLTGQDIRDDARLHGLVAFMFACYAAGTPTHNHFLKDRSSQEQVADEPFVAAIPQRLLSHPNGGALAVLGHVDMAWSYSFKPLKVGSQVQPFRNLFGRILSGQPVGYSTKDFSERYASLSTELLTLLDTTKPGDKPTERRLARLWIERNDAQNYIMLGDPAARMRIKEERQHTAVAKSPAHVNVTSENKMNVSQSPPRAAETQDVDSAPFAAPPRPDRGAAREEEHDIAMKRFRGTIRELRAHMQNLYRVLEEVVVARDLEDDETGELLDEALKRAQTALDRCSAHTRELGGEVRALFRGHPEIYDWCSDEIANIENLWTRVEDLWPQPEDRERAVRQLSKCLDVLRELIYVCGQLTIPARVDEHLQFLRIGQALAFQDNFHDELQTEEDCQRLLKYMADHPQVVHGIVDADAGFIYRASRSWGRRAASFLMLIAMLALGVGGIALFSRLDSYLSLSDWSPGGRFNELLGAYLFLVAGAVAHMIVGALKQARERADAGLVAIKDWLLWVHIRESSLLISVFYLWVGLVILAFLPNKPIAWTLAFFTGYGIDSFVDLFLQKFSQRPEVA